LLLSKEERLMTKENNHFFTREVEKTDTKLIDSKELMGKSNYLDIAHEGEVYRLRVTKYRKLILTK
jgi:hemin uptake protein HemP